MNESAFIFYYVGTFKMFFFFFFFIMTVFKGGTTHVLRRGQFLACNPLCVLMFKADYYVIPSQTAADISLCPSSLCTIASAL